MNLAWSGGRGQEHNPNVTPPAQLGLPEPADAKSTVPGVQLHDVKLSSVSTCSPSGSQAGSAAISTTAEGSEFAEEMELISVAEVRAEQQAAARETMLNLMNALQGALRMQKDLEEGRAEDGRKIKNLQARMRDLKQETSEHAGKLEDRLNMFMNRAAEFEQQLHVLNAQAEDAKFIQRYQRQKKAMAIVRESVQSILKEAPGPKSTAEVETPEAAGSVERCMKPSLYFDVAHGTRSTTSITYTDGRHNCADVNFHDETRTGPIADNDGLHNFSDVTSSDEKATSSVPGNNGLHNSMDVNKDDGKQEPNRRNNDLFRMTNQNHRLVLRWILTSWDTYVQNQKYRPSVQTEVQTECRGVDLDRQELALSRAEDKIQDMQEKMRLHEQNLKEISQERDRLKQQVLDITVGWQTESQLLKEELAQSKAQVAQRDSAIEQLRQQVRSQADALREAEATWESERLALQATIKDVSSQLGTAIAQAKHMESIALRAKRNTSDLFRDQISQLIAELEASKHRLAQTGRERDKALDANVALKLKFGQKTRQIELERQFLPLIHHAQGPLGMRQETMTSSQSEGTLTTMPQKREKFRMTQGGGFAMHAKILE